jgi:membrane protein implicated in regulation of membrane protease activity
VLPAWLTWPGVAVGALTAAAGALGAVSVESFLPLPYVGGLVWIGAVSVLLAVRPSRAATVEESEGLTGRADAVGRV